MPASAAALRASPRIGTARVRGASPRCYSKRSATPIAGATACGRAPTATPSSPGCCARQGSAQPSTPVGSVVTTAVAARAAQRVLAAATRGVGGVPRLRGVVVAQADAVVMADHRAAVAALGPVAAGHVLVARNGAAVGLRAGEDVVAVRRIAAAVHRRALFVQSGLLVDAAVGVQVVDALGDLLALGVLPRPLADAVARIHGVGAEVGAPLALAGAGGLGERLAMGVGARKAAKIRALARAGAGDEEGHVFL